MNFNRKHYLLILYLTILSGGIFLVHNTLSRTPSYSETSDSVEAENNYIDESNMHPRLRGLSDWKRPEGPVKVALQAGHWKASEAPEEFPNLKTRTGTSGGGKAEWQVNLDIAERSKKLLEAEGYIVEILPATIPPNYYADIFVSLHADGNLNTSVNGFKVASPRRDQTGNADELAKAIEDTYQQSTKLQIDPNITRSMTGYYAFNWRRYEHSLHPMTTAVIIETGFLTNPNDRKIIVNNSNKSAEGIVNGIKKFVIENM